MRQFGPGLAALLMLGACVPQPHPRGEPGPRSAPGAAAEDPCGPQVVVFVAAGDLFAAPPRRLGPPGAEELARELARENAAIERLQIAFDALMYCRWTEVRVIRADAELGEARRDTSARLASAAARMRQDVARAQALRTQVEARAARIDAAAEHAAPGLREAVLARPAAAGPRGVASAAVTLRLRPEATAPIAGRLDAGAEASLTPAGGGFVLAQAAGRSGYAPSGAFTVLPNEAEPSDTSLRRLAATNIARREALLASVTLAEQSAGNFDTTR